MSKVKGYIPYITIITITYLVFELAFNARLLDVIGRPSSENTIHSIECWGRILSGLAVTIFIWGTFVMPSKRSVFARIVLMGITGFASIGLVYHYEKNLVDNIVSRSDGEQRKEAVIINMIVDNISHGRTNINEFQLPESIRTSPSGKQMMALLPMYILRVPDVSTRLTQGVQGALHNKIVDKSGSQKAYNEGYLDMVKNAHSLFRKYADAESRHEAFPGHSEEYDKAMRSIFGYVPEVKYYRFSDFFASAGMQEKFRKALGVTGNIHISPEWTYSQFKSNVWDGIVEGKTKENFNKLNSHNASDYDKGGSEEEVGRDAMEAIVAPPIALLFSVLGALTHIFKSSNYTLQWVKPRLRYRKTILIGLVATFIIGVWNTKTEVTSNPVFIHMNETIAHSMFAGRPLSIAMEWLIRAQEYFYPVNEFIRTHILMGIDYHSMPIFFN